MDRIDRRRELRTRFMNELYNVVDGSDSQPTRVVKVAQKLGLDMSKPENRTEISRTTQYLKGEGLIKLLVSGEVASLTHKGVREVEEARSQPDQSTDHFAPINIVYAHTITQSAIQQSSPEATQSLTVISQGDLQQLETFIQSLKDSMDQLGLDEDQQLELGADIQTLKAQVASPRPKREVIRPGLESVRRILEGAASGAAASGLLNALGVLLSSI